MAQQLGNLTGELLWSWGTASSTSTIIMICMCEVHAAAATFDTVVLYQSPQAYSFSCWPWGKRLLILLLQ